MSGREVVRKIIASLRKSDFQYSVIVSGRVYDVYMGWYEGIQVMVALRINLERKVEIPVVVRGMITKHDMKNLIAMEIN